MPTVFAVKQIEKSKINLRPVDLPTFIELFAGIGGFRLGLESAGFKCIYASEMNKYSSQVYRENFGEMPAGDIKKIDVDTIPYHDVLTAGFPCQPFSISGKKKGFEDSRGTLIYEVFKIIKAKHPKVVFLENVKHLVHHNGGSTFITIIKGLQNLGYNAISYKILNASDFGVAQNRERIIIIAHKEKLIDLGKLQKTNRIKLEDIIEEGGEFEYLKDSYTLIKNLRSQKSGLLFAGYRNKSIRKNGVRRGTKHLSRVHKQPNRIYSVKGLHPTLPSQEASGRFWILHNNKVRKLTINECFKLMGFPENFKKTAPLAELYKQIGNAVCVPMIRSIGMEIKKQLLS